MFYADGLLEALVISTVELAIQTERDLTSLSSILVTNLLQLASLRWFSSAICVILGLPVLAHDTRCHGT